MSDTFRLWTHGVAVQVEYEDFFRNVRIRRAGFGTDIQQNGGTWNWFHLAIPSASTLDDDTADHYHAYLRGYVNNYAVVEEVNVHESQGGNASPRIYHAGGLNWTGRTLNENFNLPDAICSGPLCMSVRVRFDDSRGRVRFVGAGAWFEERT
ncbi:DUF6623 family protein [uncultured Roseovarius sp.]|uniref:DUF6623 family protein n=1 Tax=uncultured Roseovarius sp. TaxID=293344 RepID=UPI00260E6916|nr:DUF6623 family protein [uncultured Roseovarius sp.]